MRALLALLLVLGAGCGTAHTARPLGKGNQAVHISVGGPIGGIGSPNTFVPLTTLTYKAGLTDRADVYVGWHVLETFLGEGNLFFDLARPTTCSIRRVEGLVCPLRSRCPRSSTVARVGRCWTSS